jgi:hypothetical protein
MTEHIVPDSEHRGMVAACLCPRDLALLARFDRPIGWWLLFWPCAWGVLLAGGRALGLLLWLLLGASRCAARAASTTTSSMPISTAGGAHRRAAGGERAR